MHFPTLFLATLITRGFALPQRGSGKNDQGVQFQHFRNGRPNGRPNENENAPNLQPGSQVPPASDMRPNPKTHTEQPGNNLPNNNEGTGGGNNPPLPPSEYGTFDLSLVLEFEIESGQQPDGTGNCVGNKGVLIPCSCPPDREEFIQRVQTAVAAGNSEGVPISFPTGNSSAEVKARIGASIVVLQNLNGRGAGCPAGGDDVFATIG